MAEILLRGRKIVGGKAQGEALVTNEAICFMPGGIDQATGTIKEKNHQIEGISFAGKILVYPTGKGSTGGSWGLYRLAKRKTAPKAIINIRAEPVTATGAIIGNIPMIDQLDQDPTKVIKTGDFLEIDADHGTVRIKDSSGAKPQVPD